MPDEKIQYEVHNYEPVNKYIDDQARLKDQQVLGDMQKLVTLIMVGVGILLFYWLGLIIFIKNHTD